MTITRVTRSNSNSRY